jgi:hypothetical protein
VPLPMVSYGGSALASMMFAVGVMMNVSMRRVYFLTGRSGVDVGVMGCDSDQPITPVSQWFTAGLC